MLTVLDLFSGIGGFSLGLERTGGFKTIAFCEIDPFCRKVLAKHWPGVPIYEDITTAKFEPGQADVICGGFPCQDISIAGKRAGITGSRSGLWRYMVDAIRVVRPKYVIVENVATILDGDVGVVLGDLASIGYDAEWHCIPAKAVGAQHERDRFWLIAHPNDSECGRDQHNRDFPKASTETQGAQQGAHRERLRPGLGDGNKDCGGNKDAPDTMRPRLQARRDERADRIYAPYIEKRIGPAELAEKFDRSYWRYQPLLGRGVHGIPNRVDRIRALGNAVVPQIPELIGNAILEAEGQWTSSPHS